MVLILSRVQNVAKRLETSRINTMRYVYKIKPDSRGLDPRIHVIRVRPAKSLKGLLVCRLRKGD
jgi:hypothetical protein